MTDHLYGEFIQGAENNRKGFVAIVGDLVHLKYHTLPAIRVTIPKMGTVIVRLDENGTILTEARNVPGGYEVLVSARTSGSPILRFRQEGDPLASLDDDEFWGFEIALGGPKRENGSVLMATSGADVRYIREELELNAGL